MGIEARNPGNGYPGTRLSKSSLNRVPSSAETVLKYLKYL